MNEFNAQEGWTDDAQAEAKEEIKKCGNEFFDLLKKLEKSDNFSKPAIYFIMTSIIKSYTEELFNECCKPENLEFLKITKAFSVDEFRELSMLLKKLTTFTKNMSIASIINKKQEVKS